MLKRPKLLSCSQRLVACPLGIAETVLRRTVSKMAEVAVLFAKAGALVTLGIAETALRQAVFYRRQDPASITCRRTRRAVASMVRPRLVKSAARYFLDEIGSCLDRSGRAIS